MNYINIMPSTQILKIEECYYKRYTSPLKVYKLQIELIIKEAVLNKVP